MTKNNLKNIKKTLDIQISLVYIISNINNQPNQEDIMHEIQFFQTRPLGTSTGNYALGWIDASELLGDCFDSFTITKADPFGNGVLVKATVESGTNLNHFKKRPELQGEITIL